MATGSSVIFEQLATKSEEISGAKTEKNIIQDNLKKLKVQIDELNDSLADMLNKWSSIAPEDKKPLEKEEHVEPIHVMDKLKKKKKLTKDDILILQRTSIKR